MAQLITAPIFGSNQNDWNNNSGVNMSFSPTQIVLKVLPEDTYYSGVLCLTSITLLPTAPSTIQPVYYTSSALVDLVDDANA